MLNQVQHQAKEEMYISILPFIGRKRNILLPHVIVHICCQRIYCVHVPVLHVRELVLTLMIQITIIHADEYVTTPSIQLH